MLHLEEVPPVDPDPWWVHTSTPGGATQEVCRSLEVDLTGQTSASYNMRLNYEKCLLEFEMYLASGQYAADLAAGTAPSPDSITHHNSSKIWAPPGFRPPLAGGEADIPAAVAPMTMTTRSARVEAKYAPTPQYSRKLLPHACDGRGSPNCIHIRVGMCISVGGPSTVGVQIDDVLPWFVLFNPVRDACIWGRPALHLT